MLSEGRDRFLSLALSSRVIEQGARSVTANLKMIDMDLFGNPRIRCEDRLADVSP